MRPWELLETTTVAGEANDMRLYRRGDEYSIKTGYSELMNSRVHGSEDALAELGCKKLANKRTARVLVGGLGMGYTLAAALKAVGDEAEVVVAELVPAVIKWNQTHLSALAGSPLDDKRTTIYEGDVGKLIRAEAQAFDAILLDVDNGPDGLTRKENDAIYSPSGLEAGLNALRPKGIFAVWSTSPDPRFTKRMQKAGFKVEEVRANARGKQGGGKHNIWFGIKK
jgi:spermidine synthase